MERFSEQTASDLGRNYARNRFAEELAESLPEYNGPACENCRQACSNLVHVPEFDYMGCPDCVEEALTVIAKERGFTGELGELYSILSAEEAILAEAGCTPEEAKAFRKAVKIERMQGELFAGEVA